MLTNIVARRYIESKRANAAAHERQVESLNRRRERALEVADKLEKASRGKGGDQKKGAMAAERRKKAMSMGLHKTADGRKWKYSEMGSKDGSLDQHYGKQTNGFSTTDMKRAAESAASPLAGGDSPFRVSFLEPAPLKQPHVAVLQVREVSFRWPGAAEDLLSDVTITVHDGDRIALVGANGQGKSTLGPS